MENTLKISEDRLEKRTRYRLMLWSFYAVAVIMKNIFATKIWKIGLFQAPAGYLFEPITFIAQDVETEVNGYQSAKKMIFWVFLINIVVALAAQVAIILPSVSPTEVQTSFSMILGNVPRILIASLTAYLIGGTLNSKIMDTLKGKGNSLLYRAIVSTIFGQLVDNLVFSTIAFSFVMPFSQILYMSISMTFLETMYEILFFPITKFIIGKMEECK